VAITLGQMNPQAWFICGPVYEPMPLGLPDLLAQMI
jgi:hypothetical protein